MFKHRLVRPLVTACLALALCAVAPQARAQQLIIKGMYGMMAGTQAPPGVYAGMFGGIAWADEIRGPNGNAVKGPDLTQETLRAARHVRVEPQDPGRQLRRRRRRFPSRTS